MLELECFADLLSATPLLSRERQIGLVGELMVLTRLTEIHGPVAVNSWIGPIREPHDFRAAHTEFEVKTTMGVHRVHRINGDAQLLPSNGRELYLVSIVLAPAGGGAGLTLSDQVDDLFSQFGRDTAHGRTFREGLKDAGYFEEDRQHYTFRYTQRRSFAFVPVSDGFPALTLDAIGRALGESAHRIEFVSYDVNVEALGIEDNDPATAAILDSFISGVAT